MSVTNTILTDVSAGITQLKVNPMGVIKEAKGAPVAILNRNKPAFYAVPCELFETMMEALDKSHFIKMGEGVFKRDES